MSNLLLLCYTVTAVIGRPLSPEFKASLKLETEQVSFNFYINLRNKQADDRFLSEIT